MLAGDQLGQILALLLGVAVAVDLVDAEIRVRAVGQADRRRAARDLLHRDAMREIAQPCPAVFLGDRDAEHAEFAELRPQIARETCWCGRSRRRAARSRHWRSARPCRAARRRPRRARNRTRARHSGSWASSLTRCSRRRLRASPYATVCLNTPPYGVKRRHGARIRPEQAQGQRQGQGRRASMPRPGSRPPSMRWPTAGSMRCGSSRWPRRSPSPRAASTGTSPTAAR